MAHEDLNCLLNELLPLAQQLLDKHGEFFPFGGYVDAGGGIAHVSGWTGEEQPPASDVIEMLVAGLKEQVAKLELRATAICINVRTVPPGQTEKTDAICMRLEHANGEAVDVYMPYRRRESGEFKYEDLFAAKGERVIFPEQPDDSGGGRQPPRD